MTHPIDRFRAQASATPGAEAVTGGGASLTYGQLQRRVDRLAGRLRARGVGPESRVGVLLHRTPDLPVALLAVLDAGAAYVPIDPSYPSARIDFVLADAGVELLLTEDDPAATLRRPARPAGRVPWMAVAAPESEGGDAVGEPAARREAGGAHPSEDGLAYVLYTSGSTGRPKGVMVSRRGLASYLSWAVDAYGLGPGSRVPIHSPIGFDLTITSLFAPLLVGGRIVLLPDDPGGEGLVEALGGDDRWDLVKLTPTHLRVLRHRFERHGRPAPVRTFVIGGEALFYEDLAFWRESAPELRLVNEYGPTETVVGCSAHEVGSAAGSGAVPIGRPIAGAGLFVATPTLELAGEAGGPAQGELVVAGPGVARGYLGRPARTAERFVPDPFSGERGSRLYRTGDEVRRLPGGELEFLGRIDRQVKVRGHRIEPGEVEEALARHDGVREAAVVARPGPDGAPELVAFVSSQVDAAELRRHLERALPPYMVPAHLVRLDALPLGPHGKVDREALPDARPERPTTVPYAAPRDELERRVAAIWGELLGLDRVGVHDDFFELGGQSLLAMRILARLRDRFGVDVSFRTIVDHPTIASLAGHLETLRDERRRDPVPLTPVDRSGDLPLSYSQERIWFLEQLDPSIRAYQAQSMLRMRGTFRIEAWRRALTELLRRHEIFRTTFHTVGGRPVQRVRPPHPAPLPLIDLSALPPARRERELTRAVDASLAQPFDVTRLPVVRWTIVRLAPDDHVWLNVEHHLVHDGWSFNVLLSDQLALYRAFVAGRPSPLPDLRIQFGDFAVWQRRWVESGEARTQVAYWREALAGRPDVLELPTDRPRPRRQSYVGRVIRHDIPTPQADRIRELGRREGVSLFTVMEGAFAALLARYSDQERINVGSAVANRRSEEVQALTGMVVNNLVLPNDVPRGATVRDLLRITRAMYLEADAHQDVPFDLVVEALRPARDPSRNPLFQVSFSFHDSPAPALDLPDLEARLTEAISNRSSKWDLNVICIPGRERAVGRPDDGELGITVLWEYSRALFDPATADRMAAHYRNLLAAMAEDPARPVWRLPMMGEAERREVLARSVSPPLPDPDRRPVHLQVLDVARRMPDATAVSGGAGRTLSFGALDERSRRLARRLRARGAGPHAVVGVLLARTPDWVTAVLAVLRTGAAYLPIDPADPAARVAATLTDSGAVALIADPREPGRFDPGGLPVPVVDPAATEPACRDGDSDEAHVSDPDDRVYVVYTSGSTGRPKGVEVLHGGLTSLVAWHRRHYAVTSDDRASHVANAAFDAAAWEVWPHLAAGAGLHMPPEELRAAPRSLLAWLASRRITLSFLTTPLAQAMLEETIPDDLSLRALLTGGDRMHAPPPGHRPFRLVNHYGPTEVTVLVTATDVPAGYDRAPTLGRPIPGARTVVLDRELEAVPVGVPGELFVGGPQLSRGYLGRPRRTAASFVPDPWSGEPGGRLYRTGDRVRERHRPGDPDDGLELLGRIDQQVKIRGFRIEPGEIETVLTKHPGVERAVVDVRPVPSGGRRLVAYWVGSPGLGAEELERYLRERLPDHLVPGALVALPDLPLTSRGKVDRAALPEPEPARDGTGSTAPRTPLERALATIWTEVLGAEGAALEDDFFHAGGHSLLATRLLTRCSERLGLDFRLHAFFEAPTLGGLAAVVAGMAESLSEDDRQRFERRLEESAPAPVHRIPRRAGDGSVPLGLAQERLWFLQQITPGSAAYHIARAFALRGPLDLAALATAFETVIRRHEALRTRFPSLGGRPVQEVMPPGPFRLPVIDLSGLPRNDRERGASRARRTVARHPFDLERGPLLRVALLLRAEREAELLYTLHHIVADGWSLSVLYDELARSYALAVAGEAGGGEPEAPVQFPDFALWQRERLDRRELERLTAYWRARLEGAPAVLDLPADRPATPERTYAGDRRAVRLSDDLARSLRKLGESSGATLFMILSAGFSALLHRYGGQERVVTGLPVAGRPASELERSIGLFVDTLALTADLSGELSFAEHLGRVEEATLGALAHQEMPFERLVEAIAPERDLAHSPIFQVLLSVESTPPAELALPGVEAAQLPLWSGTAQFDLSLSFRVVEAGGRETISGSIVYDRERFDGTTIRRLEGHLLTLLAAAAAAPGTPVSRLPLMTAAERHQLVVDWNGAREAVPGDPVHRRFERVAAEWPDAAAVTEGGVTFTYGELDRRSNRAARRLRELGTGFDTPVALALDRSAEMVVSLLAVLKSGGAYVPLDLAHPAERSAAVLDDTRPAVVVTRESLLAGLPALPSATRVLRVEAESAPGGGGDRPLAGDPPAGSRAYVLFTSGSTGRPKGVEVTRGALNDFLAAVARRPGLAPGDRMLAVTTLSFDIAVVELLMPLLRGGCVVIAGGDEAADGDRLAERLAQGISLAQATPATWRLLVASGWRGAPGLRGISGGEALPADLAEGLLDRMDELWNIYGPTETTVWSTARTVPRGESPVRIGGPLPGTRLYALDPALRPVPVGVAGELAIGGAGLARGYLGRPGQTAERFVPDPFGGPGERLFRTGDLVRRRDAEGFEFLGRIDRQVKLRGFRIEPGEIEAALGNHGAIRERAVVLHRDGSGEDALVAYYSRRPDAVVSEAELRHALERRLPAYMVPAAFVDLPELPRTGSGKIDRRALAGRPLHRTRQEAEPAPPRGPAEEVLVSLFGEVLGLDRVGIHDAFFALGGHSLQVARVVRTIREVFQVGLTFRTFFRHPTVAGLSEALFRDDEQRCRADEIARLLLEIDVLSEGELDGALGRRHP